MLYVGVDLHRKSSHVAVTTAEGVQVMSKSIRSQPMEFMRIFGELEPEPLEVAFEATFGWGWFADLLQDMGIPAHMAHPLGTKAISSARVKNDSVDAKTLADLLRGNLLPETWIAPREVREARTLVRSRVGLVRMRSKLKVQVHALIAQLGMNPEVSDLFGTKGRAILRATELPQVIRNRVDANLRMIDGLKAEIDIAERELRELFSEDDRLRRLLVIPGIGFLTAATVIAEVWDVRQFRTPGHLCSWAGLTPGEHSSAGHIKRGHITKQGSTWLRWAMVEAVAGPQSKRNTKLANIEMQIAKRRGRKIARVAAARHLLTLCYYALRDPKGCKDFPM